MDFKIPEDLSEQLARGRDVPKLNKVEKLLCLFTPGERLVLYALSAGLALSSLGLISGINASISVNVPSRGGTLTEGIVEPPRFINPVLALSQSDEDLTQLVYSGLTRTLPTLSTDQSIHSDVVPDIAEKYEISDDGTTYTFTLRESAKFHDGTSVTADDVLFTVQTIQKPENKSPRRADWEGVSVASPNPRTVIFKLQHAYAPFLENTSIGILPKHLWGSISSEEFPFHPLNTHPIGSGPYKISSLRTDSTGAATSYSLDSFNKFTLGAPYIKQINFQFYPNEESLIKAFNTGQVNGLASVTPANLASMSMKNSTVMSIPLPRVFGVFFNQSRVPALADSSVRSALNVAVDKNSIVDSVLGGYGVVLDGPIPPGVIQDSQSAKSDIQLSSPERIQKARDILSRGGWTYDKKEGVWKKKKQVLTFSLATSDSPELSLTANKLVEFWQSVGIPVNVKIFPLSELNTNVIRPRAYDAILFGEVVGRTLDLFAFWHSTQRNDPGLNLAMYANAKTDSLLSSARALTSSSEREELYRSFEKIMIKEQPAIFVYSPEFIYIVPENLKGVRLGALTTPSERFQNVFEWYTDTERVWNFLTDRSDSIYP